MVAALLIRLFLGELLLLAALPKLRARADFERAVVNYDLLPTRVALGLARVLPVSELLLGAALVVGALAEVAATAAGFFFITFAIAAGINLLRGRQMDCGCHGAAAPRTISWTLVTRDVILAGAAAFVAVSPTGFSLLRWPNRAAMPVSTSAAVALSCIALVAALVEGAAPQLLDVARLVWQLGDDEKEVSRDNAVD